MYSIELTHQVDAINVLVPPTMHIKKFIYENTNKNTNLQIYKYTVAQIEICSKLTHQVDAINVLAASTMHIQKYIYENTNTNANKQIYKYTVTKIERCS